MVGSASEAVPRETSGIREDRHGGCAPVSDEEVPSVATSQEADPPICVSCPSTCTSDSLPNLSDPDSSPAWTLDWRCPCRCLKEPVLRARAENLRSMLLSMSRDHRKQSVWVALCKLYRPGEPLQFNLFGHHVCRRSWYRAMATGSSGLQKMQKSLLAGALGPPQDARCGNIIISKHPERHHDVDRFFIGVGQRLPKIFRMNVATRRPAAAASATQFWALARQSQAVGPSIMPT